MNKSVKKTNKVVAKVAPLKPIAKAKPIVKKDITTIRSKLAVFDNMNLESKAKVVRKLVPTKLVPIVPVKTTPKVEIKVTVPPVNKKVAKCLNVYTGPLITNKKPDAVKSIFSDVLIKKITVKKDVFEKMIRSDKTSSEIAKLAGITARTVQRLRRNLKK